jgi:NAD-dependent SIR2 family protein deacetylase
MNSRVKQEDNCKQDSNMPYYNSNLADKADIAKTAIAKADFILIGAGSGLSAASGLLYNDFDIFSAWFPGYYERYGLRSINEASFFKFPTPEEYYAFWSRLISRVRYKQFPGKLYIDLYLIIKNKKYFILTTNTDGQFLKVGFPSKKICAPQGDYAFFQCSCPCNNKIYHNRQMIERMLTPIGNNDFAIKKEDIPHCPDCGSTLLPNVRTSVDFVEEPWIKNYMEINSTLSAHNRQKLLLLELGVGYNTPNIIRFPFELLTLQRKNTELIRINLSSDRISLLGDAENATIIQADIGKTLHELAKHY